MKRTKLTRAVLSSRDAGRFQQLQLLARGMEHCPILGSPLRPACGDQKTASTMSHPVAPASACLLWIHGTSLNSRRRIWRCCSVLCLERTTPGGRMDLPLRQWLGEAISREPGGWRLWTSEDLTWSCTHPTRLPGKTQGPRGLPLTLHPSLVPLGGHTEKETAQKVTTVTLPFKEVAPKAAFPNYQQ